MADERRKGWKPNWILVFLVLLQLMATTYGAGKLTMELSSLKAVVEELRLDVNRLHPRQ